MTCRGKLCLLLAVGASFSAAASSISAAATIVEKWSSVVPPDPPKVQRVKAEPPATALLLLDFVKQTCNGPRCIAALPGLKRLLHSARAQHVPVIYSYTLSSTFADTLAAVKPLRGEPSVQAGPDKFIGTNLQQLLKQRGIRTVVVAGTSAQGAVLSTASHAALVGYSVIVPIDAMPSETLYAEQFVVWNLANAPQVSTKVKLTTIDQLIL